MHQGVDKDVQRQTKLKSRTRQPHSIQQRGAQRRNNTTLDALQAQVQPHGAMDCDPGSHSAGAPVPVAVVVTAVTTLDPVSFSDPMGLLLTECAVHGVKVEEEEEEFEEGGREQEQEAAAACSGEPKAASSQPSSQPSS